MIDRLKLLMLSTAIITGVVIHAASLGNVGFLGSLQRGISYPAIPFAPYFWYDFQNNTNDSTPNAINLTNYAGTPDFTNGIYQKAISLERSKGEYLRRITPITTEYTNNPTFVGWFRLDSVPAPGETNTILSIAQEGDQNVLHITVMSNYLEFFAYDDMGGSGTVKTNIGVGGWQTNVSYFFMATCVSRTYAAIGLNNNGFVSNSFGSGMLDRLSPLINVGVLAFDFPATNTSFNGWIDSLCMYTNAVLTSGQLSNLYNGGNGNYYH